MTPTDSTTRHRAAVHPDRQHGRQHSCQNGQNGQAGQTGLVRLLTLLLLAGLPLAGWGSGAEHAPAPAPAKATAAKAAPADAPEASAAPAPVDPIERLRQRLSERLSGTKTVAPAGAYGVRISSKGQPVSLHTEAADNAAAPGPAARVKAAATRPAGKKNSTKAEAHADPAHWDYKGSAGPAAWGGLKPEFSLCNVGQRQSPIDIRGGLAVDLDPVRFDYDASKFAVLDNGHTVQVNLDPGNSIEVGGRRYELQQFHFHRPSEERIDGRQFEMSLHLVHKDEQGRLAVVGLLFDKGPPNPVLQKVWANLPLERGEPSQAREPLALVDLLPTDKRYYTYMGSLTTPPCSEGVLWIVMRQPVMLTQEQIDIFARIYPMNARPLQQAAGRRILQSN